MTTTQVFRHRRHGVITGTVVNISAHTTTIRLTRDHDTVGGEGTTHAFRSDDLTALSEPVVTEED